MLELDGDPPGARVQSLLGVAALVNEPLARLRREVGGRDLRSVADEADQHVVEVVAAELVHPRGGEHLVAVAAHADERCVEGAAAEVVDDDVVALRSERAAVAVGVLEPRGRGLVQHRHRPEARAAKCVEGHEPLRAMRVRGDGHDAPKRFCHRLRLLLSLQRRAPLGAEVRLRLERHPQGDQESLDELP